MLPLKLPLVFPAADALPKPLVLARLSPTLPDLRLPLLPSDPLLPPARPLLPLDWGAVGIVALLLLLPPVGWVGVAEALLPPGADEGAACEPLMPVLEAAPDWLGFAGMRLPKLPDPAVAEMLPGTLGLVGLRLALPVLRLLPLLPPACPLLPLLPAGRGPPELLLGTNGGGEPLPLLLCASTPTAGSGALLRPGPVAVCSAPLTASTRAFSLFIRRILPSAA